jgi:hypothetical protein
MKFFYPALAAALATSTLASVAAAQVAPASAAAIAPDRLELARQFINQTLSFDDYVDGVKQGYTQIAAAYGEDQDEAARVKFDAELSRFLTLAAPTIRKHMPLLSEAYAKVYAREFTAEELQQMIVFARTPAGKHYISRVDILDLDPEAFEAQRDIQTDLEPIARQIARERCAARAAERIAAGDKKAKCPLSGKSDTAKG